MLAQTERNIATSGEWTASLTYRSEAATTYSKSEINALVAAARARNHSVGVTGMLLYDGRRFLQTLEGQPEAVDLLWASIQRDTRHGAIEVLSQHIVPARLFSGRDMQLYYRSGDPRQQSRPAAPGLPLVDHIPTIARFALAADDRQLNALIGDLVAQGWVGDALVKHLLEPAARVLGDAWLSDDCSEIDLTVGLSMLQLAGHVVHSGVTPNNLRKSRYSILLVTAPGEPHMLGPSLLGDMFNNAGWAVDIAFPDNNDQLARQLRSQRPDAVDIGLSEALPRRHALAGLSQTVEKCRAASPDEVLVVSVGGRLFNEAAATAQSVGADHARSSAAGTSVRLARLIEQHKSRQ